MASFYDDYAAGNALGEVIRKGARKAKADVALTEKYGDTAGDPEAAASLQQTDQRAQAFPLAQKSQELSNAKAEADNADAGQQRQNQALLNGAYYLKKLGEDGGDLAAGFDQINNSMLKLPPEVAASAKAEIAQHGIKAVDGFIEAFQKRFAGSARGATPQRYQIIQQPDGSVVRVPVTGEGEAEAVSIGGEAVRGYQAPQGAQRIANTQANIKQDYELADPTFKAEQEAGKAVGKLSGGEAANLPQVENVVGQAKDRIQEIRDTPAVEAIFGVPTIAKAIRDGGFGKLGTTYGSEAADAAAKVTALRSQLRSQAYATLKGGGSITETESQFAAEALANLDRAQSYASFIKELSRLDVVLDKGVAVARTKAHMTSFGKKAAAGGASAPAEAPAGDDHVQPGNRIRLKWNPEKGIAE